MQHYSVIPPPSAKEGPDGDALEAVPSAGSRHMEGFAQVLATTDEALAECEAQILSRSLVTPLNGPRPSPASADFAPLRCAPPPSH